MILAFSRSTIVECTSTTVLIAVIESTGQGGGPGQNLSKIGNKCLYCFLTLNHICSCINQD